MKNYYHRISKAQIMKSLSQRNNLTAILTGILFLINSAGYAQFSVASAKSGIPGQTDGIYYALPRTTLKFDFILEKTVSIKGPYSQFAERMLGVQDYVNENSTTYRILDLIVTPITEPDPDAVFFVRFDDRTSKDEQKIPFTLQSDGIILGVGPEMISHKAETLSVEKTLVNSPEEKKFNYFAERNLFQRIDTIVRKITIDTTVIKLPVLHTSWQDRNPEQKARAAADYIQTIREARYLLLSGYQEINYGNSLIYMDKQLKQLEEAYLSLFLGINDRKIEEHPVYYTPNQNSGSLVTLARLSDDSGIVKASGKGETIQILVEPIGISQKIPGIGRETLESVTVINSLLYRNPEIAQIEVSFKGKTLCTERLPIPQLGTISVVPLNKNKLSFDAKTGQIIKLIRE
ncbi:MAG: DUF4831 family protein [Bacteroidales bacterium]|nr:DUF4831 family protein [Bacteroidales bacterium]HOI31354.1 DUF4831 family protein [Bacteroidales bacterium]